MKTETKTNEHDLLCWMGLLACITGMQEALPLLCVSLGDIS